MKSKTLIRTARLLAFLPLVAIFAALTSLSFFPVSAASAQTETSETLAAPVLTARRTGTNTVELSWTAVTGAVRYELNVWHDGATGWQSLDDGSLTSTSYTHGGLAAGTTYWYTVRAVGASGATSDWSAYGKATDPDSATPAPTTTPTPGAALTPAPTDTSETLAAPVLTARPTGTNTVELSWTAVTGAVRYELWAWQDRASGWQRLDDGSLTSTSYTHGGLAAGTTYTYIVRAVGASGASRVWSAMVIATVFGEQPQSLTPTQPPPTETAARLTPTPVSTVMPAPTATPTLNTTPTPTLTFSCANSAAIPDPEAAGLVADCETLLGLKEELAGSAALNWRVDRLIENWEGISVESGRVAALSLANSGLTGGVPSSLGSLAALAVLDLSSNGLTGSIPSSLGNLTALQNLLLHDNQLTGSIPSSLDSLVPPSGSLSAVWLATDNALCGPIPPQLHAFVPSNPSSNNDVSSVHYPSGTLGDCSSSSPTPTATPTATSTPTATAARLSTPALTATATEGGVALSWGTVQGAVRYELMVWWDAGTGWQPLGGDNLTGASYTHTGVTAGTTYYYSIRAVTAAGETSYWLQDYASATVPTASGSPLPTATSTATPTPTVTAAGFSTPALTAQATEGGVDLSWSIVQGAVRYELMVWWDAGTGWQPLGGDNLTGASYTHTDVTAGTTYYYSIRAVNAAGETSGWLLQYASATAVQPR